MRSRDNYHSCHRKAPKRRNAAPKAADTNVTLLSEALSAQFCFLKLPYYDVTKAKLSIFVITTDNTYGFPFDHSSRCTLNLLSLHFSSLRHANPSSRSVIIGIAHYNYYFDCAAYTETSFLHYSRLNDTNVISLSIKLKISACVRHAKGAPLIRCRRARMQPITALHIYYVY